MINNSQPVSFSINKEHWLLTKKNPSYFQLQQIETSSPVQIETFSIPQFLTCEKKLNIFDEVFLGSYKSRWDAQCV